MNKIKLEDKRIKNFTMVENEVIDSSDLSSTEKLVYIILCRFAWHGECFPSFATIAERAGISRRHAVRVINALCEKGLLEKQKQKKNKGNFCSNAYTIIGIQKRASDVTTREGGSDMMSPGVVTSCHQGSDIMSPEEYYFKNTHLEEYILTCDSATSESQLDQKPPEETSTKEPSEEQKIVKYLYTKFKELGVKKSQAWFKKQIGIARQLLARYPPEQIKEVIDFAFQDAFWKGAFSGLEHFERVYQKKVVVLSGIEEGGSQSGNEEIDRLLRERTRRFIEEGMP